RDGLQCHPDEGVRPPRQRPKFDGRLPAQEREQRRGDQHQTAQQQIAPTRPAPDGEKTNAQDRNEAVESQIESVCDQRRCVVCSIGKKHVAGFIDGKAHSAGINRHAKTRGAPDTDGNRGSRSWCRSAGRDAKNRILLGEAEYRVGRQAALTTCQFAIHIDLVSQKEYAPPEIDASGVPNGERAGSVAPHRDVVANPDKSVRVSILRQSRISANLFERISVPGICACEALLLSLWRSGPSLPACRSEQGPVGSLR